MEVAILGVVLLLLVVIAALGAAGALFVTRGSRRRVAARIEELESRLARLEAGGSPAPGPAPARSPGEASPEAKPVPPAPAPAASPPASPFREVPLPGRPAPAPGRFRDLEEIVGGQWLTWIGVLTLFFGTAFFLSTRLGAHPLAGTGQVLIGALVGALFIGVGHPLAGRAQRFLGQGLLGGGIALLFLASFASFAFHDLVPPLVIYPFLLGVAGLGASLALNRNSLTVASLTALGALLTPLLLQEADASARALFPYLGIVNLGIAAVAARRRWAVLPLMGFAGTVILTLAWWDARYDLSLRGTALAGVSFLWLVYFLLPLLTPPRRGFWGVARTTVVVLNGFAFLFALLALLEPDRGAFGGVCTALLALVYVLVSRAVRSRAASAGGRATYYGGLALAATAIPIQLDGSWVTFGWALYGLILIAAGLRLPSFAHRVFGLGVAALGVGRLLTWDSAATLRSPETRAAVLNPDFAGGLAVVAAVAFAGILLHRNRDRLGAGERRIVTAVTLTAAFALLWRISVESIAAYEGLETVRNTPGELGLASLLTLSLIWAVYAGLAIAVGFAARSKPLRLFGVAVLGVLVLKVFLLDIQELERGYRIASFAGVGFLLLVISLLYQRERRT